MSTYINNIKYTDLNDLIAESGLNNIELEEIKLHTQIVGQIIKARNNKGMTQKDLEQMSGIKQPQIARIEKGTVDPQIKTILRILKPLGMTLAVVPDNS
jgi:DNA-binding XRE family transcriptional regulator